MIVLRRSALVAGFLAIACLCATIEAADRTPVPPAADVDRAQKTLKEVFKTDYAKTKLPDRMAFATKMYLRALETTDDNAAKIAMLKEAGLGRKGR